MIDAQNPDGQGIHCGVMSSVGVLTTPSYLGPSMSKLFITGGAGFVGSRVVHKLVTAGHRVWIYDSFRQYVLADPRATQPNPLHRLVDIIDQIEVIQGDTLCRDHMRRTLQVLEPDIIIHMAALPLISVAIQNTEVAADSILTSTLNVLEIMRDFKHPCRLVYTSSSTVYGDFVTETVKEDAPTNPKDVYGSFKLCGEINVRGFARCYDLDVAIVRPTAVYGPTDANKRVIQKFIMKALNGETLKIDGDGSLPLDFTYVDDTADGFILVATHPNASGETFNIARGHARPLSKVLEIIQENICDVKVEYGPVPDYMPRRGTLDVTKAREMLGYSPKYDLEQGIPGYIAHLKTHSV